MKLQFQTNGSGAVRLAIDAEGKQLYWVLGSSKDLANIAADALKVAIAAHNQIGAEFTPTREPFAVEPLKWLISPNQRSGYANFELHFGNETALSFAISKEERLRLINLLAKGDEQETIHRGTDSPAALIQKAYRHLTWTNQDLLTMAQYAPDHDRASKSMFNALTSINAAAESILITCSVVGAKDVQKEIEDDRRFDPLLSYLIKARNTDVHQVMTWSGSSISNHILFFRDSAVEKTFLGDPALLEDVWRKALALSDGESLSDAANREPNKAIFAEHGIELITQNPSIALHGFDYWEPKRSGVAAHVAHMPAPTSHLGKPLPNSALAGIGAAINYYQSALKTLAGMCGIHLENIPVPSSEIEWVSIAEAKQPADQS